MRRRSVLAAAGTGIAGLAGCGFRGDTTTDAGGTETPIPVDGVSTPTRDGGEGSGGDTDVGLDEGEPFEVALGFERGLAVWTVWNDSFTRTRDYVRQGGYSGGVETDAETRMLASASPGVMRDGVQLETVRVAWIELSGSDGGGVVLQNSAGESEVFVGASDPEWVVASGQNPDTLAIVGEGPVTERWVEAELSFDWGAGTVTTTVTDVETDRSASATVGLAAGRNVETIVLTGFSRSRFEAGAGFVADSCAMYWDGIRLEN